VTPLNPEAAVEPFVLSSPAVLTDQLALAAIAVPTYVEPNVPKIAARREREAVR
jgi:hypothetical protein